MEEFPIYGPPLPYYQLNNFDHRWALGYRRPSFLYQPSIRSVAVRTKRRFIERDAAAGRVLAALHARGVAQDKLEELKNNPSLNLKKS